MDTGQSIDLNLQQPIHPVPQQVIQHQHQMQQSHQEPSQQTHDQIQQNHQEQVQQMQPPMNAIHSSMADMSVLPRKGRSNNNCCVVGCKNTYSTAPGISFYSFPNEKYYAERRQKWIRAVNRVNPDGTTWIPKASSRVCSAHFAGGIKSEHPMSPAFIPTLNLGVIPKQFKLTKTDAKRRKRLLKKKIEIETEVVSGNIPKNRKLSGTSQTFRQTGFRDKYPDCELNSSCTQTDFFDPIYFSGSPNVLFCSLNNNDAQTQTKIELYDSQGKSLLMGSCKELKSTCCGPDDRDIYFTGVSSISDDEQMRSLTGVSVAIFHAIASYLANNNRGRFSVQNRLLLFLMKMKLGLAFSSLSVVFGIHRTTASRVFVEVLKSLTEKFQKMPYWPNGIVGPQPIPGFFKDPNVNTMIDCVEFETEKPRNEQQVSMYSNSKGLFTLKYLVAVSPNGYISYISKGYGGQTTNEFIIQDTGYLRQNEANHINDNLLNQGYRHIINPMEKNNLHVGNMPDNQMATPHNMQQPMQHQMGPHQSPAHMNHQMSQHVPPMPQTMAPMASTSAEGQPENSKTLSLKMHFRNTIMRIKMFKVLDKIPLELFPQIDSIAKISCVLINMLHPTWKDTLATNSQHHNL